MKIAARLFAVVLVGLWLLWMLSLTEENKSSTTPNIITFKHEADPKVEGSPKETVREHPIQSQSGKNLNPYSKAETEDGQAMSYMALYRMSRVWRTCEHISDYQTQNEWFDAALYLTSKIQQNDAATPNSPPPTQIEALHSHANKCLDLQLKLAKMDLPPPKPNPNSGLSEPHYTTKYLMQLLSTYKTTTSKEQALANVIKHSQNWVQLFSAVLQLSEGNDSTNKAAIQILQDELRQLRIEQSKLVRQPKETHDDQFMTAFGKIVVAIGNKEQAIQDLMVIDQDLRTQAIEDFSAVNDQLFDFLKSQDPDVFYEAQVTLETKRTLSYHGFFPHKTIGMRDLKQPFTEYVFPEDVVMHAMGLNNPDWFGLLIPYATQLYVCELGADCGPDSEWIKHHCFQTLGEFNPVSCGLDLPTFYQYHLLSQNHFEDVQTVLDVMRGLYAE